MTLNRTSRTAAHARLLQFASQALPTGAYAYSAGLESLLELGWLDGADDCRDYLISLMKSALAHQELPLFLQLFDAAKHDDPTEARRVSRYLLACRETKELQDQEAQMGRALSRVLAELRPEQYARVFEPGTFSEALAWAAHWFGIEREEAAVLFTYSWVEQQVSALCRLLPLGPIAGQRLLDAVLSQVPGVIERAQFVEPEDVGASAPALAIASALHETQYCRVFRS